MNICDHTNPDAAHILVVLATGLALLIVIRLLQGRSVITRRDAVEFSLISVFAICFHTPHQASLFRWKAYYHHTLVDWKDTFVNKFYKVAARYIQANQPSAV